MTSNGARFVRICRTSDVAEGHGKSFRVGSLDLAIFHSEGEFYATCDICSHEHEFLSEGWLEGAHVECPRHGAMFDLRTGAALSLPATEPVEIYPLEIRDGEIWVAIPEKHLTS